MVKKHEEECTRRPVKCECCQQAVALVELRDHLISEHEKRPMVLVYSGVDYTYKCAVQQASLSVSPYGVGNIQHPLGNVPGCDTRFIYNWQQLGMLNLTMFWVSVDVTPKEAENYKYTLEIHDPQDHEYLFKAERPCVSADVSHETMKERASAILLDIALLERALKEDEADERCFDWRLKIRRK